MAWDQSRKKERAAFLGRVQELMDASKGTRDAARTSKQRLQAERATAAAEVRRKRRALEEARRARQEKAAVQIKENVNVAIAERFAPVLASKRMLEHPHFAEVRCSAARSERWEAEGDHAPPTRLPHAALTHP